MTFQRILSLAVVTVALSGCVEKSLSTVSANYQFSNAAGLGTQNAGLYEPGSAFLWNIGAKKLEFLDTLDLTPTTPGGVAAGDVTSTNVAEMGLTGLPSDLLGDEGLVKASIGAKSQFVAKGARREDYRDTITALGRYVEGLIAQGNDPDLILHPRDDNFRVVIVRSVVRAEDASLFLGGTDSSDPNKIVGVSVNLPGREAASFKVRLGTNTSCGQSGGSNGKAPPCFFNTLVLDPHYVEGNPRMQFRVGIPFPEGDLPDAFRSLR